MVLFPPYFDEISIGCVNSASETQPACPFWASQIFKINFCKHIIESHLFSNIVSFTFPPASRHRRRHPRPCEGASSNDANVLKGKEDLGEGGSGILSSATPGMIANSEAEKTSEIRVISEQVSVDARVP